MLDCSSYIASFVVIVLYLTGQETVFIKYFSLRNQKESVIILFLSITAKICERFYFIF